MPRCRKGGRNPIGPQRAGGRVARHINLHAPSPASSASGRRPPHERAIDHRRGPAGAQAKAIDGLHRHAAVGCGAVCVEAKPVQNGLRQGRAADGLTGLGRQILTT